MLQVKNVHARIHSSGKEILKGISLSVLPGEIHAIMGPNGAGKSTFAGMLMGNSAFQVTKGEAYLGDKNLLELSVSQRAAEGLFIGFQYPVVVPGIQTRDFLKISVDCQREHRGEAPMSEDEFDKMLHSGMKLLGMSESDITRCINEGFSGGEKKRNEVLQMALLQPKVIILDEIDSGLDVDALRMVAANVNKLKGKDRSIILVTHYSKILEYIVPTHVHVLREGRIVKSGDKRLAEELEISGYEGL